MVDDGFTKSPSGTVRPAMGQPIRRLADFRGTWHGRHMEQHSGKASRAGGVIIAFSIMAGVIIGNRMGQSSLGMVIGTGIGVIISLILYLHDRRRG